MSQAEIGPLLRVAEMLKIRGLTEVNGEHEFNSESKKVHSDSPRPPSEHRAETPSNKKSRPHKRLSGEWDENQSNTSPPLEKHRRSKRSSPAFDRRSTDSPRIGNILDATVLSHQVARKIVLLFPFIKCKFELF